MGGISSLRAARRHVGAVRRHHQQGAERKVGATECSQNMQELMDNVVSWVSDVDRQLKRFAASLEREVIVDCSVDNTLMDELEQWLGLSIW